MFNTKDESNRLNTKEKIIYHSGSDITSFEKGLAPSVAQNDTLKRLKADYENEHAEETGMLQEKISAASRLVHDPVLFDSSWDQLELTVDQLEGGLSQEKDKILARLQQNSRSLKDCQDTHEIGRLPIVGNAVKFIAALTAVILSEAVVTGMYLFSTGLPGGLPKSISLALIIGLFTAAAASVVGYLCIPYAHKVNTVNSVLRWVSGFGVISISILVLLGQFYVAVGRNNLAGADQQRVILYLVISMAIYIFMVFKFYRSEDPNREYGRLGKEKNKLELEEQRFNEYGQQEVSSLSELCDKELREAEEIVHDWELKCNIHIEECSNVLLWAKDTSKQIKTEYESLELLYVNRIRQHVQLDESYNTLPDIPDLSLDWDLTNITSEADRKKTQLYNRLVEIKSLHRSIIDKLRNIDMEIFIYKVRKPKTDNTVVFNSIFNGGS